MTILAIILFTLAALAILLAGRLSGRPGRTL
jgi:hypothetical protein